MMSDWLYQTLAQQYKKNLDQINQYLLQNLAEQRRLACLQQQMQLQFQQQIHLSLTKQQVASDTANFDVAPLPVFTVYDDIGVSGGKINFDSTFVAKAKEQKVCQEIYEKLLQQMNGGGAVQDNDSLTNFNSLRLNAFDDPSLLNDICNNAFNRWTANGNVSNFLVGELSASENLHVAINQAAVEHGFVYSSSLSNSSLSSSSSSIIEERSMPSPPASKTSTVLPPSPSTSSSCDVIGDAEDIEEHRPYRCTICDKRFRFKSNLFEHKSLHIKSQAFHCPFCGKTCRLKALGNLKKHLQVHVNTVEDLEKLWKKRFSRSSGRPRKDTPPKPLPAVGDDLGLVPINKSKPFFATWVFSDEVPTD